MDPNQSCVDGPRSNRATTVISFEHRGEQHHIEVIGDLPTVRERLAIAKLHGQWTRFTTPDGELIHVRPPGPVALAPAVAADVLVAA